MTSSHEVKLGKLNEGVSMNSLHLLLVQSRTADARWSLVQRYPKLIGKLIRHNDQINNLGICDIFAQNSSAHFVTVSPLSMIFIILLFFPQKSLLLRPNPNILAVKNLGNSHHASIVRGYSQNMGISTSACVIWSNFTHQSRNSTSLSTKLTITISMFWNLLLLKTSS